LSARILLVEDNEVNRYLVCFVLEKAGFVVDTAVNGLVALEAARARRPDLILMDLRMPVLDGYETTRRLKADPDLREIPVAALSAQAMPAEKAHALEVGCIAHFEKPIDVQSFPAQVRALLRAAPGS
jgi:CheY-like chemotaxis protein